MKNLTKLFNVLFGIIALSAVMICVFIACDANDPGDDDDKDDKSKNTAVIPAEYQDTVWRHYIDELQEDYSVKKVLDGYKLYLLKDKVTVNKDNRDLKTYPFAKTESVDGGKVLQFDTKNEVAGLITFKDDIIINAIFPNMGSKTGDWLEEGANKIEIFVTINDIMFQYYEETESYWVKIYSGDSKNVIIPEKVNNVPVTVISAVVFKDEELTSVTIPNSVTEIGTEAFQYNPLTSITIPSNVLLAYTYNSSYSDYTFDQSFDNLYNNNGKAAGTYTRPNTSSAWTKQ